MEKSWNKIVFYQKQKKMLQKHQIFVVVVVVVVVSFAAHVTESQKNMS